MVVLYVEDSIGDCAVLRAAMRHRETSVLCAHSLADAREMLAEHENLAAVYVDLLLPDGLGTDLVREIRSDSPLLPVFMVIGGSDDSTVLACLDAGARFVYTKATGDLRDFVARTMALVTDEGTR